MKRHLVATCALAMLVLASSPTWAADGNINLYFDAGAALCATSIPACGGQATMYVYALLQGASQLGITGAEYKIQIGPDNLADPTYFYTEHWNPDLVVQNGSPITPEDPTTNRGTNLAWASCQTGDGTKILLETIDIINADCGPNGGSEVKYTVVAHDTPSNGDFRCPLFTLCDSPTFTKVCLGSNKVGPGSTNCRNLNDPKTPPTAQCSSSGTAYANPVGSHVNCTVAVTPSTWSTVKGLYRAN